MISNTIRHAFEAMYSRPPTAQWDEREQAYVSYMEGPSEAIRDELRTYTSMLYAFSHGVRWEARPRHYVSADFRGMSPQIPPWR